MTTTVPTGESGRNRWLIAAAAALPLLFVLHARLVSPRPYTVSEIDIEHDYYYNAKLVALGQPLGSNHHPGTPVYYISSVLLRLSGLDLARTQQFFDVAYALVALASAGALAFFCSRVLRRGGLAAAVAALALLLSWPPVMSYWSYYGADSWSLGLGLLAASFFWIDVSAPERGARAGILCGAAAGLGLAVKMTFLPLVLSLLVGKAVLTAGRCGRVWRQGAPGRARRLGTALVSAAALPAAVALAYGLATMPIIGRLPAVWLQTFQREEVRPPAGAFAASLRAGLVDLWRWNPALAAAAALVVAGTVAAGVALLVRGLRRGPGRAAADDGAERERFDAAAAGAFLGVLLLGFVYTLASSVTVTPGAELGIRLRNTAPSALVLPFMVLFVDRIRPDARGGRFWPRSLTFAATLGTVSFVLAWTAIAQHRQSFVETREARSREVRSLLPPPSGPPRRLAFWTESADDHFGEVSFHLWGNYRYGHDRFDAELLRHYPGFTLLRLRDFAHLREAGAPAPDVPARAVRGGETRGAPSRYGRAGTLFWSVSRWLPRAFPKTVSPYQRERRMVTGENTGLRPAVFAFQESQLSELRGVPFASFVRTLEERFGALELEKRNIAGESWFVLRATDPHAVGPERGARGRSSRLESIVRSSGAPHSSGEKRKNDVEDDV